MTSIAERFQRMDQTRTEKLNRAREASALVNPSLLPPQGHTEDQQITVPYSSVASKNAALFASRVTSLFLPTNGDPAFEMPFKPSVAREAGDLTAQIRFMTESAMEVTSELYYTNLRQTLDLAMMHLAILGDCLLLQQEDQFQIIRLDQYVCTSRSYWRVPGGHCPLLGGP